MNDNSEMGLLDLQLACCCGSAACSLCCAACPSCKNSTASRIAYSLLLIMGTIIASIFLVPGLQTELEKVYVGNNGYPKSDAVSKTKFFNVFRI
jgi:hypothetical protein